MKDSQIRSSRNPCARLQCEPWRQYPPSQSLHKRILYRGIDLNTISVSTSRRSTILHHKEIGTSEHNFQGGQSNDSADYGSSQIIENTPAPRISLTPTTSLPWRSRCKLSSTAISEPLNWANWSHFVSNLKTRKTNTNDVQFHQLTTSSLILPSLNLVESHLLKPYVVIVFWDSRAS
jgi:hypothetical protein